MNILNRYFIILALGALLLTGAGADVWVSNAGLDANNGTTVGTPKLTLGAALNVLQTQPAGSTLTFLSNITENAILTAAANNGTAANPIVIEGGNFTLTGCAVVFTGQNITVQNLNFDANSLHEACVVARSSASGLTLDNCDFTKVSDQTTVEHFNTEDTEEADVSPVQIFGAENVTINNCDFNNTANAWDFAVLMGNAAGLGRHITISGCNINAETRTAGIMVYRKVDNVTIEDTVFDNMVGPAFDFDSAGKIVSGTSYSVLLEDLTYTGSPAAGAVGAININQAAIEYFTVRRVTVNLVGALGEDGFILVGSTASNMLLDGLIVHKSSNTTTSSAGITILNDTTYIYGLTIQNCEIYTPLSLYTRYQPHLYNVIIQDSTFENTDGPFWQSFYCRDTTMHGLTIDGLYLNHGGTSDGIAFFYEASSLQDFIIRNSKIFCGDEAILILRTAVDNILIENCEIMGNDCITNRDDALISNAIVRNCSITSNDIASAGCLSLRSHVSNMSVSDCTFSGNWGIWSDDYSTANMQLSDVTLENIICNVDNSAIMVRDQALSNLTINNCYMSGGRRGFETNLGLVMTGANITNTSFVSRGVTQSANGLIMQVGAVMQDSSFTNVDFISEGQIGDVTDFRHGGLLAEDPDTTIENTSFTNCSFQGGNVGIGLQRYQISTGAGAGPNVDDVTFTDCTIDNVNGRGISMQYGNGGDNVTFSNIAISNVTGIAAHIEWDGNNLSFDNLSYDGNGNGSGIFLGTVSPSFIGSSWMLTDSQFTNLNGIGIEIGSIVQDATISNVTVDGMVGSGIGIKFSDNNPLSVASISNILVTSCELSDIAGSAIIIQGPTNTVQGNRIIECGNGIELQSGRSEQLSALTSTYGNLITRNYVFGGGSGTGILESINAAYASDPGAKNNVYLNNTVTDWADGGNFFGRGNRIQNDIFAYNTGNGLLVQPTGMVGLLAGFNCCYGNTTDYAGSIAQDVAIDLDVDPQFVSRDPSSPNFYLLTDGLSACVNAGTTDGSVGDNVTDMGCRESGVVEVGSWRLY
jgi:Right handed beta helix region